MAFKTPTTLSFFGFPVMVWAFDTAFPNEMSNWEVPEVQLFSPPVVVMPKSPARSWFPRK